MTADDRDLLEVEQDDLPAAEASNTSKTAPIRRVEYRDLFTQLRQVN